MSEIFLVDLKNTPAEEGSKPKPVTQVVGYGMKKSLAEEKVMDDSVVMYGLKKSQSKMADEHNRDGETVDNQNQADYFGERTVLHNEEKGSKLKLDKNIGYTTGGITTPIGVPMQASQAGDKNMKKSNYHDIYLNKKGKLGPDSKPDHLGGDKNQPTKPSGKQPVATDKGQAIRDIEVRPADQKIGNRGANQDAFDDATQGRLLKLQTTDKSKVIYLSVMKKVDGQIIGYSGSSEEEAFYNAGQGYQGSLRKVNVVGETRWTAEIIPEKRLMKSNPSEVNLFSMAPENQDMLKSIKTNAICLTPGGAAIAQTNHEALQKSYDLVNAFVAVLHKSYDNESIFYALEEQAAGDGALAKAMDVCEIDNPYVRNYAGTLGDPFGQNTTEFLINKAARHNQ